MKKFFNELFWGAKFASLRTAFYVISIIIGVGTLFAGSILTCHHFNMQSARGYFTFYADGVEIICSYQAEFSLPFTNFTDYKGEVESKIKNVAATMTLEEIVQDNGSIASNTKLKVNEEIAVDDAKIVALATEMIIPDNIKTAMAQRAIVRLDIEAAKMELVRDSLMSVAAKRDAEGYTAEAERLESRREQRFEKRTLEPQRIQSNERIEVRKAEAREKAASNVGFLSGSVVISE